MIDQINKAVGTSLRHSACLKINGKAVHVSIKTRTTRANVDEMKNR